MQDTITMYSQTFAMFNSRFNSIFSFRRLINLGRPHIESRVYHEFLKFAHDIYHDAEYDKYFTDRKQAVEALGGIDVAGSNMANNQLDQFQNSIDSASLVFAHSVIDAAAYEYCLVTSIHSPESWEAFVSKKQFSLEEIKDKTYKELLENKIEKYFNDLEKESLLKKVDKLFQICQPPNNYAPINDYKYDRERLETLDQNRHDIVHKDIVLNPLPKGDDDIWFLYQTAMYLMGLVNMKFGLKMDVTKAMTKPPIETKTA